MKLHYLAIVAAACALAACQSSGQGNTSSSMSSSSSNLPKVSNTPPSAPQKFECKNGMTATVQYLGNEKVSLTVNTIGKTIQLSQIRSGSGSLYENKNGFYNHTTQWHQKGDQQGHLSVIDPYNNAVETACYAK